MLSLEKRSKISVYKFSSNHIFLPGYIVSPSTEKEPPFIGKAIIKFSIVNNKKNFTIYHSFIVQKNPQTFQQMHVHVFNSCPFLKLNEYSKLFRRIMYVGSLLKFVKSPCSTLQQGSTNYHQNLTSYYYRALSVHVNTNGNWDANYNTSLNFCFQFQAVFKVIK